VKEDVWIKDEIQHVCKLKTVGSAKISVLCHKNVTREREPSCFKIKFLRCNIIPHHVYELLEYIISL
jgi:hypothetical protein